MNPLAIWLHVRLSGPKVNTLHAAEILIEQVGAMQSGGLLDAADVAVIGVSDLDYALARKLLLYPKFQFEVFQAELRGELPTLSRLQKWVQSNGHYVHYSHLKCATRADSLCAAWRRCMTRHTILNWRQCVGYLDAGKESVGAHWMLPEESNLVKAPYWGGNFWLAKAEFLRTLPPLTNDAVTTDLYYLSESWIGLGPRRPRVHDFHHVWPNEAGCLRDYGKEYDA